MATPEFIQEEFSLYQQRYNDNAGENALQEIAGHHGCLEQLQLCLAASKFCAEQCIRHPVYLEQLLDPGHALHLKKPDIDFNIFLEQQLAGIEEENAFLSALRQLRNHSMLRIIWRDINRISSTMETTRELSALADAAIKHCNRFFYKQFSARFGEPVNADGEPQSLLVIAMGKLGAFELNLSSDIDLLFCYPESGTTSGPDKTISNQEFFIKLGQGLIRALDQVTGDGFVFRVDMRLRPYGNDGPLVCNFDALEDYYQKQGRNWERYAMVKARPVTGSSRDQQYLMDMLRPFTYRKYIDFSAINALREMKAMINREVKRKNLENNIKLGRGGIREVEFIAQAFQLIRGGRDNDLQQRELLPVLALLAEKSLLPEAASNELEEAYLFLRNVEHAIQAYDDRQTQLLPDQPEAMERLAFVSGFDSVPDFMEKLAHYRNRVRFHFDQVISDPDEQDSSAMAQDAFSECAKQLWECQSSEEQQAAIQEFSELAVFNGALDKILDLKQSRSLNALQAEGKQRLDTFIPLLLEKLQQTEHPAETLNRLLPFVQAVIRRSAYLLLLIENPGALKQLVTLSSASPWIAEELTHHPVLLDELLDERTLFTLPEREELRDLLRQEVIRIPLEDLEGHMEALRYFRNAHRLRIAACEVTGQLPLMKVSDYLTFLAEVILEHALAVAWHHMTEKAGLPTDDNGNTLEPGFIIVGYGKLGGLELGHNSDLDIIFIHNAKPTGMTSTEQTGHKSLDNSTFYVRLAQRIIHILEARTHGGQLYEADTRLRPSGDSGMLVSSLAGFEKYQRENAWTWEHQALVRARAICGCETLSANFEQVRKTILGQARDDSSLRKDIIEMRTKMRTALGSKPGDGKFHLKQDSGGIVDIEFLVQYTVLAWSHEESSLLIYPDNIRILEQLAETGRLSEKTAQELTESYKILRSAAHRLALQQQPGVMDAEAFQRERAIVISAWEQFLDQATS
jgi:glutamate-ammonia-ligase adenylyltransferase